MLYQCKRQDPPPYDYITYGYVGFRCDRHCKCKRVPAWYVFQTGRRVLFKAANRFGTVDYATRDTVYVLLDGDTKLEGFSPSNLRRVTPSEDGQMKLELGEDDGAG